ncbi:hypothetical protein [Lacipirellula sp.]|uniref:hypothetical protein n=1 Tax=Lacipirellula sp. TaxID=2691419 RepID=UPI003D104E88
MSDWSRKIEIDPDWQDYEIQITPGWTRKVSDSTSRRNRLIPVFYDFAADLSGATMAASLPYLLTSNIVHYHKGYVQAKEEPTTSQRLADVVTLLLARKLRGRANLTADQLLEIQSACLEIQQEFKVAYAQTSGISHDYVWDGFMKEPRTHRMAWHSQQLCFVAAFSAFENFLVQSVAVAMKQPTFKKKRAEEFPELRDAFGQAIYDQSWSDKYMASVRLARNAILHNGGRETDSLRTLGHGFLVKEKMLQIKASDNTRLLRHLEASAESIIHVGSQIPAVIREKKRRRKRRR